MKPLAGAVQQALKALHLDAGVDEVSALEAWSTTAARVFGEHATRAIRVDNHTLVVVVPDSAWAGEIRLRERDLLRALKNSAPRAGIKNIRCAPASEHRG